MTITRIERTSIWKNTLAYRQNDEFQAEREILRSAFLSLRNNTSYLVTQIASALPELTQHEVSHLDALWETASLIVGESFELTPLEGFVLGSSFLLHDSALCFEAFENGREGLRGTTQWKDAFEDVKESNSKLSITELEHNADFVALRHLHAFRAETLLNFKWKDPSTDNEIFLMENQGLRFHLGKLIGQIASSHHWDIETVISTFNTQINAPTNFPREWRIDPVKLACILRCADAVHIDNERAPDFLHVLLKRSGVSFDHWKAQNRLAKVDIDQSDPIRETLLFTSTIDFKEPDSNAWFVAYDAICLAEKEIKSSNSVLEKRGSQKFKVQKVKGVEKPENMAAYIKADGWEPHSAKVHVGNVERIVHNLGGEMLYGTDSDNLGIVLRELIQNARDSIKARIVYDNTFDGKIIIRLNKNSFTNIITIEDNGIGMSERILTGPLLDFGTSFWASSLVQSEFPGLRSSKFKSIGKFGIGFYSVFMIAEKVFIASRNFNSGLSDVRQLKFTNGFSLRPVLSKGAPQNYSSALSTQISLHLKPNIIPEDLQIEIKTNIMGSINFKVPFEDYLSALCAGLDVPVFYQNINGNETKIHENISIPEFDLAKWLTTISFVKFQPNPKPIKEYISKNISRLKPIYENGIIVGIAAISTKEDNRKQDFLSISTVGGLAVSVHYRDSNNFIGYLDYTPKSAKRETGQLSASEKSLEIWARDQLNELTRLSLSPIERYFASSSLCYFKVDPREFAQILVVFNGQVLFLSFDQLAELSLNTGIAFLKSGLGDGEHMETHHNIQQLEGYILVRPLSNSFFLSLKRKEDVPENNFSILDCLYRSIIKKGYTPFLNEISSVGANVFGQTIGALLLSSKM
jgi:hypothetical protein